MNDIAVFLLGVIFGGILTGTMLLLCGQWLFASGAVFMQSPAEKRIRDLAPLSREWPQRPHRRSA